MKIVTVISILAILLFLLLVSCAPSTGASAPVYVDLNHLSPLPTPIENEIKPFRVAIAAVISPQGSAESYEQLMDFLSAELDRPIEAVQRRTYSEVNDLIKNGQVDLAFVCTSSYLVGRHDFGMQLLAAPVVHGEVAYRAKIIVPAGSSAREFADLRGKVFAFTDPISFTGRVYPTYLLQEMGETPESFFKRTFFTYSHDDAIQSVANGLAEGASVDSLILDFAIKRDPGLASQIRVIHTSETFGMPPVVVGAQIRPQLKAQLEEILLKMHTHPQGAAALQALDYDRFVPITDEAYQSAFEVESRLGLISVEQP